MALLPGALVVGGQYRLVERLGSGGFGTVFLVETVVGRLRRALKVLHPHWSHDSRARERFVNEALVLEQINHPGIARCYAAGVLDDGESLYLLMELVDGQPLRSLLESEGPLAPARAVRLAGQVASALAVAHAAGVLHRDLKPENILVAGAGTPRERAITVDFGIATAIDGDLTTTRSVVGTPAFMAPEQFRPGDPLDARVDLWQLGAVLFVMLTGQAAYDGASIGALLALHDRHGELGPLPSVRETKLGGCQALDTLVGRLLATRRDARPRAAAQVCSELVRIEQQLSATGAGGAVGLLEALCATPGQAAWRALCRYIASDRASQAALVATAETLLAPWPDELRVAPLAWWDQVSHGDEHPLWPLARTLDLSSAGLGDEEVAAVAALPAIASLTALSLARNDLGPPGARALAASPHTGRLRRLDLSHTRIGSTGVEALAGSDRLPSLETLSLAAAGVGPRGAEALAATRLPLRALDLGENRIEAAGAIALASSAALERLESLSVHDNGIGPDGMAAIATSRTLGNLRELDVSDSAIGPSGAAALALSPHAGRLRSLSLARNGIGVRGVELLVTSNRFALLERLDLSSNDIGAAGAMALAASPLARRLKSLDLGDNGLGDTGLAALLGAPQLAGLRTLGLSQNQLTPAGVALIGGSAAELEAIDLSGNPLGESGAQAVAAMLRRLRIAALHVNRCGLGGAGLAAVLEAAERLEVLDAESNDLHAGWPALVHVAAAPAPLHRLNLSGNQLGPALAGEIVHCRWCWPVRDLVLNSNAIGDQAEVLRSLEALPSLERLSLEDNGIGPLGAAALAASLLAARLVTLDLAWNALGDAGASALASGRQWTSLHALDLQRNDIGLAGCAAIRTGRAMPMLMRAGLDLNAVRGLVDVHSLGDRRVTLLEESFALLAPGVADLAERFYDNLFTRYPGVKPLFARVSMRGQQQHFLAALTMVIESLRTPDLVITHLRALGERHRGYGVMASHYPAAAVVLLETLRGALGPEWTPEVESAWQDGLDAIARAMLAPPRRD